MPKSKGFNNKVSVITPVYNLQEYIGACIESVLDQTYSNFELIIVDDASTDNSVKIIEEYSEKDARITFIRMSSNSGPAVTRNTGIKASTGRFLTFLDGDDIWLPHMIEKSMNTMREKKCGFVFASYKRLDENLKPLLSDYIVPSKVTYKDILKSNSISCLTAFIDVQKLGKKCMPLIRKRQDMGLWLAYLKEIDYAVGIKEPLAIYRIRKGSLSRNKFSLIKFQWEFYTKHENLNFFRSSYYMAHWMVRGILKYRS
jgi:glycosyltransferase involved in cell wall biosynthesis